MKCVIYFLSFPSSLLASHIKHHTLFPLSRGQGGFPAYAYARKRMFAFFPTLPPHFYHAKLRSKNPIWLFQNLLCANSKGIYRVLRSIGIAQRLESMSLPNQVFPRVNPSGLHGYLSLRLECDPLVSHPMGV